MSSLPRDLLWWVPLFWWCVVSCLAAKSDFHSLLDMGELRLLAYWDRALGHLLALAAVFLVSGATALLAIRFRLSSGGLPFGLVAAILSVALSWVLFLLLITGFAGRMG